MKSRLRILLNERGLTAQQLADMVGCQKAAIDAVMLRGISNITRAKTYAMALNVHVWELFMEPEVSAINHPVTEWKTTTRLEEIISKRGIKQYKLAEKMGKDQSAMSGYIKSDHLSMTVLEEFAQELDLPVWQLLISPEDYEREMAKRRGEVSETAAPSSVSADKPSVTMEKRTPQPTAQSYMDDLFGWANQKPEEIMEEEALLAEQEMNEELRKKATRMLPVLSDGEYRYGNMVLILKNGVISTKPV